MAHAPISAEEVATDPLYEQAVSTRVCQIELPVAPVSREFMQS